ncbi:MAG: CidA/LrgA family protein [Janthinobacterium lividum]
MLRAFVVILFFQCVGEGLSHAFHLPVPGAVVGMLLLLVALLLRPATAAVVEPASLELLRHLSLLFIPAGVGIMASASQVRSDALAVVVSVAVSTVLAIAVTALVMRALLRRQRRIAQSKRPA